MDTKEFRTRAHELVDWMADYLEHIRDYPVKSQSKPGEIIGSLPLHPPASGESFDAIFSDFKLVIVPGVTHWQHPSCFGYFPANSSAPSILAEMLTATLAAQCMIWQTSPSAAELEERVLQWLREMIGLPRDFEGVIQDTASTATLCSILTAREKYTNYAVNERGLDSSHRFVVYCSSETHSSIDKAVKIAGLGKERLHKVAVDDTFAMDPKKLERAIEGDRAHGLTPLCVVATIGTTGSTAVDPLKAIGEICRRHKVWLHVDAAFAGTALILPEMRWMSDGVELADTFVFNPHKWMLTNFDCTAYFVKDREALVRTFEILPEYLKTPEKERVNNYRDWGVPLGRRFRALKLWFVIRSYGVEGLQKIIRNHIAMATQLEKTIRDTHDFEILAPRSTNLVCFRYHPKGANELSNLNDLNERLENKLNASGKLFLTHTKLHGAYTLRMVIGQTNVTQTDVDSAWTLIQSTARAL